MASIICLPSIIEGKTFGSLSANTFLIILYKEERRLVGLQSPTIRASVLLGIGKFKFHLFLVDDTIFRKLLEHLKPVNFNGVPTFYKKILFFFCTTLKNTKRVVQISATLALVRLPDGTLSMRFLLCLSNGKFSSMILFS